MNDDENDELIKQNALLLRQAAVQSKLLLLGVWV